MFKRQSERKKSKSNLIGNHFEENTSNFKTGSIQMSNQELFFVKSKLLNEVCAIPKPYQQFRIVTQKAINSFDFILAILDKENIEELIVAFYRIGKKVIQEIHELQKEEKIKKAYFLINDAVPKLTPDAFNLMKSVESDIFKIRLDNNHTKIILIRTAENYYVIEGSGNLSINARIEQYAFDNHKELFEFHKNWIIEL